MEICVEKSEEKNDFGKILWLRHNSIHDISVLFFEQIKSSKPPLGFFLTVGRNEEKNDFGEILNDSDTIQFTTYIFFFFWKKCFICYPLEQVLLQNPQSSNIQNIFCPQAPRLHDFEASGLFIWQSKSLPLEHEIERVITPGPHVFEQSEYRPTFHIGQFCLLQLCVEVGLSSMLHWESLLPLHAITRLWVLKEKTKSQYCIKFNQNVVLPIFDRKKRHSILHRTFNIYLKMLLCCVYYYFFLKKKKKAPPPIFVSQIYHHSTSYLYDN